MTESKSFNRTATSTSDCDGNIRNDANPPDCNCIILIRVIADP